MASIKNWDNKTWLSSPKYINSFNKFLIKQSKINLMVMPLMLLAGFLTPWPYNYWRLKKFNKGCCN